MLSPDAFVCLCRARDLLGEACENPLTIRDVAKRAGISPFHFIRQFQALFGETPHQFRMRARLNRAKLLLATSNYSVTDVCMEVGFSSLGSFSDLFTRRIGVAPSSYRKTIRSMMAASRVMPPELTPGCLTLMGTAFATFEKQPTALLSDSDAARSPQAADGGRQRRGRIDEDQAHQHHGRQSGQGAEVLHRDLRLREEA